MTTGCQTILMKGGSTSRSKSKNRKSSKSRSRSQSRSRSRKMKLSLFAKVLKSKRHRRTKRHAKKTKNN